MKKNKGKNKQIKKPPHKNEAAEVFNKQINYDFPGKDILQQLDSKIINRPENFEAGNSLSNLAKEANNNSASCWGRRSQITEKICELVNSQKSESLVTKIRFSLSESEDKNLSEEPWGDFFTSKFRERSNLKSSERIFSSSRNFSLGINNDIIFLGQSGSVGKSGRDMFFSERGESAQNTSGGGAGREHIQNLPNHNSGSAESRFAVANVRVGHDVIINDDFHKNKFNNYNSYYSKNIEKLSN